MRVIRAEKQKDNFAKFLYDIAKIIIAVMVIGPIAKPESFNIIIFTTGIGVSLIFFIIGQTLDNQMNTLLIGLIILGVIGIIGLIWVNTTKSLQDPEKKPE